MNRETAGIITISTGAPVMPVLRSASCQLVDDNELAGVVPAEPRVEVVLRSTHRADPGDHTRGLGEVLRAARAGRVVDRKRNELVAIVRTAPKSRLVGATTRHAH